jgi:PAB-dependent poly(A)-specific ribonuclease subunit 2
MPDPQAKALPPVFLLMSFECVAIGVCCIDDYVRTVEPVYDYLTRFSGLVPGDLDPSTSPHYLTTLKVSLLLIVRLIV